MKINVTLQLEIDAANWCEIYGTDPAKVRADVREYVADQVAGSAAFAEGGITSMAVKAS